jgi:hypothetical protein
MNILYKTGKFSLNNTLNIHKASRKGKNDLFSFSKPNRNFCDKNNLDKNSKILSPNEEKQGIFKKIKNSFKKYGKFGIGLYTVLYIGGFGAFYYLIENKVIQKDQVVTAFEKIGLNKLVDVRQKVNDNPKSANLVLAYIINYAFDLIRIPACLLFLKFYFKKFRKL